MYIQTVEYFCKFSPPSDFENNVCLCRCKRNIEEEEAAAEAKVRSLVPEDTPHPSLYGIQPPSPEILIHVQGTAGGAEVTILILFSVLYVME